MAGDGRYRHDAVLPALTSPLPVKRRLAGMSVLAWHVPPLILLGAATFTAIIVALRARRRAAAALARAAAAGREAAASTRTLGLVAAELRGPSLAVLGQAERLCAAVPAAAAEAGAVAGAARHLLRLAESLTELVAAGGGPPALVEETFPLGPLLQEAVTGLEAQLGHGRRHWRVAPDLAALSLYADRRALRGALEHVLARAARLSRDGDWIELRLEAEHGPESFAILVEDEGSGLPTEDLAAEAEQGRAWGAVSVLPRTRGMGLGLAVARTLLQAHGGGLVLEAAPGIGARASLILPRTRRTVTEVVVPYSGCEPRMRRAGRPVLRRNRLAAAPALG
jgi:signal transduction histidine kinase